MLITNIFKRRESTVVNTHDTELFTSKSKPPLSKNYLWIVFFIKKFIEKLKKKTIISNISKLNAFHYEMLSDKTTLPHATNKYYKNYYENSKKKDFFSNRFKKVNFLREYSKNLCFTVSLIVTKFFKNMSNKIIIFEPDHPLRFFFDIFIFIYTVTTVCQIFVSFGFMLTHEDFNPIVHFILESIAPWVFIFEILIILNTSYYSKGVYIRNRKNIINRYLKESLWLDIITLTPLVISNTGTVVHQLELLYTLRLFKIKPILNRIEDYFHFKGKKEAVFHLFKLIMNLLFLAHICACLWQYTALWEIEIGIENNWLKKKNLQNESWEVRYVYSLYFAVVTMMTVGYGDITSNNYYEVLINIFIIIYGCGVFAYTINDIGLIFKEMNQDEKFFKKRMKNIIEYMNKRKLNKNLQLKIKRYLEYMYEESQNNYKDNSDIKNSLSQTLKEEFLQDLYGKILKSNKFFQIFSPEFLIKLSGSFKEQTLAPDDTISNINENEEINILFILKGEANIIKMRNELQYVNLGIVKENDTIGEKPFITGQNEIINLKSKTVTHIAFIKRSDFLKIINLFKEDQEKLFEFKDKLIYSSSIYETNSCLSCLKKDHCLANCPLLHFIPNYNYIINKHNFYEPQNRTPIFERRSFKMNSLLNLYKIQESSLQIIKKNDLDEDISQFESEKAISSSSLEIGEERKANSPKKNNLKDKSWTEFNKNKRKSIRKSIRSPAFEEFKTLKVELKHFSEDSNQNQISNQNSGKLRKNELDNNYIESMKKLDINDSKPINIDIIHNFQYYFPENNFKTVKLKLRKIRRTNTVIKKQKSFKKQSNFATLNSERIKI